LEKGHINFKKKKSVFELLEQVQKFQSKAYDIQPEPVIQEHFRSLPRVNRESKKEAEAHTKHLFELSLQREPRNAKKSEIL
jgi:hypothetical protein